MKLITRDTDYAIRALCYITKQRKRVVPVKDLAGCLKIPRPFLRKILQKLNKKHLVKSYKGVGGGFVLSRSPDKIFIVDLIKTFQGPIKINEHLFKKKRCPHVKKCVLKQKLDTMQKKLIAELKSVNVASLI